MLNSKIQATVPSIAKIAAVATGLAMATSMLAFAPNAQAAGLTPVQVSAIVSLLQSFGADSSTIANVQASLTGGTVNVVPTLKLGSRGAAVVALQKELIAGGYKIPAGATGYYGAQTQAAVNARAAHTGSIPGTVPPVSASGLKVGLSATSPSGSVLVQGQGVGVLGEFTFTNPSASPVSVNALSFRRTGVSNDATLANVYLYNGATRLTDSAGVNGSSFTYSGSPLFVIPANSTFTVAVRSDIATGTSGQQVGVSLVSVTSSTTLDSSVAFPINSGYQTVSAADLATVSFNATTLPSTGNISPQSDYPVWQNTVSVSTNAVKLSSLRFTNLGSIDASALSNLRLYVDGVAVGSPVSQLAADRTVTFDLSSAPLSLSTQSHVVKVLADVVGGASRTFDLSIQRTSDAMFIDSQLNQPVTPTVGGSSFSAVTSGTVTVNAVTATSGVSVTKSPSSTVDDVAVGATSVKLASFDVLPSGENVKVNDLFVYAVTSGTNSGSGLNNGKVFLNGYQVGSTKDLGEGASNATDFSMGSSMILLAGKTSHVDVYADAQNAAGTNLGSGATIVASLKFVASNAQGQSSLASTAVPGANVSGNTVSVAASTLAATKYSGYSDQTLIPGTTNALLGSFTLSAGSTEGLSINTIGVNVSGNAGVTNLRLVDRVSGSTIGTAIATPSATGNSFSVNVTLPASGTKTVDVRGDILSSANQSIQASLQTTTTSTGVNSGTTSSLASAVNLQTISVGSGQLYAVRSANNPLSTFAVAGAQSVNVGAFTFSAVNSAFTVQKVLVKIPSTAANAVNDVTVSYKDADGNTRSSTQSLALTNGSYANATFTGLNFFVPNNGTADLSVSVSTPTIASGGAAISGDAISAVLDHATGFQAVDGSGSSTTTPGFITADVNGANGSYGTSVLRKSFPTIAAQSYQSSVNPTSGSNLFRFTVSADQSGPVDLYKVSFNIATSGLVITNLSLYDANDTSTALNSVAVNAASGATTLTLDNTGSGAVSVAAGSSRTFVLRGTVGGSWGSGASVSTQFAAADSSSVSNSTAASVVGTFVWSDESANNHSVTSTDWTNGYLVKNLSEGTYNYSANF